jgi:hypothetical protein
MDSAQSLDYLEETQHFHSFLVVLLTWLALFACFGLSPAMRQLSGSHLDIGISIF